MPSTTCFTISIFSSNFESIGVTVSETSAYDRQTNEKFNYFDDLKQYNTHYFCPKCYINWSTILNKRNFRLTKLDQSTLLQTCFLIVDNLESNITIQPYTVHHN